MADSAVSPEPGSFPKRRPAAVSRLAVPNEAGDAQQACTGGLPSCRSDAAERGSWPRVPTPPLSASSHWRPPRLSKPGYQLEPVVYHKVWSIFCLLLLVAVASVSTNRQRQLAAVLSSVQQKHRDDMNLQVAWLAASMTEHEQCKAAVQKADTDYQAAKGGLQKCEAGLQKCESDRKHSSSQSDAAAASSRVAAAALQVQLDASRKHLKEATQRLKKAQGELRTAHQQQQQQQVQLAALQAEKEQWLKDKEQQEKAQSLAAAKPADVGAATTAPLAPVDLSAPHTAATAAALQAVSAAHHTDGSSSSSSSGSSSSGSSSSSGADMPVVLATCSASDLTPDNLITPWCEAVAAAGVPRVLLVSDDAGCAAAAKAAGIKVLQHTFQVPTITGPLAEQNMRAYRRYAALAQVLSLGHAAVSVEPEVLLLSDPLPLLYQHPTDVTVMSAAAGDERMAYGHVLATASGSNSGSGTPPHPAFQVGGLSHALLYLKPQQPALHFVQAMMDGLASGDNAESALLNSLLLGPWHLHSSQQDHNSNEQLQAAPGEPSTHTASSAQRGSEGRAGAGSMPVLQVPVTLGVLPPALFTHSGVVFGASDPTAWLKQQQPVAVHLLPGPSRPAQAQTVLDWLEADIQEVIQMLGHLPEELASQPASSSSKQERKTEGSAAASEGPGEVSVQDTPQQQSTQQEQQQSEEQQQPNSALPSRQGRRVPADRKRHRRHRAHRAVDGRGSRVQQGTSQVVTHKWEERKLQEQPAATAPPSPAAAAVAAVPAAAAPAKQTSPPPPAAAAAAKQGPKQQQAAQQAAAVKADQAAAARNAATKTAASAAVAAAKVAQQRQQQGKQVGPEQQAREEQQQAKQQGTKEQQQQAQKAPEEMKKKKKHHRKQVH